ncbi:MAG: zinc ribbon domain-containing protein [Clostridia bacterium]|nr:zinc ribbon domain-containing protein [Clostridia bacterium]
MKTCQNCGYQLDDYAVSCYNCGAPCPNSNYQQTPYQNNPYQQQNPYVPAEKPESPVLAIIAIIIAFFIPIVGFVCGIIGTVKYKASKNKTMSIIAIVVSIVMWLVNIALLV